MLPDRSGSEEETEVGETSSSVSFVMVFTWVVTGSCRNSNEPFPSNPRHSPRGSAAKRSSCVRCVQHHKCRH